MVNEEYELILFDRIEAIKSINKKYDLENNSYVSFSGGRDSTILHYLIDLALPNNKIPRVFTNTGIEYVDIVKFVKTLAVNDERFVLLPPTQPIKKVLETYGYPFKSKQHSHNLSIYSNNKETINKYIYEIETNKDLLKDYNYIHNLPTGVKSLIKYIYGIRERDIYIYIYLQRLSLTH